MIDSGRQGPPGPVYERIQDALEALGAVETAVGNAESDVLRHAVTEDLNAAVVALQAARDKVAAIVENGEAFLP